MQLHEIKYEARKRRHHPQEEAEIKMYQAITGDYSWLYEVRHMKVFKNGTVAYFFWYRYKIVLWIDDGSTPIPVFPSIIEVYNIPREFVMEKSIPELRIWLNSLLSTIAQQKIQAFIVEWNRQREENEI